MSRCNNANKNFKHASFRIADNVGTNILLWLILGWTRSPVILNSNDITKHVFSIKKRECNSSENGLNSTQSKNKGDVFIFIFLERDLVFELT